jgi:hypothetical protein
MLLSAPNCVMIEIMMVIAASLIMFISVLRLHVELISVCSLPQ